MGLATALTLSYVSGGTVTMKSFDESEVRQLDILTHQKTVLKRLQNGQPNIRYCGPEWREAVVQMMTMYPSTITNIETLQDIETDINLTALYGDSSIAEHFTVRINPNLTLPYSGGKIQYNQSVGMTFYECITGLDLYDSVEEMLDDGWIEFEVGVAGWGNIMVEDGEEWCSFIFDSDGTVLLREETTNMVNTNTNGKFCIFDDGFGIKIMNRLGSTKTVAMRIFSYTP